MLKDFARSGSTRSNGKNPMGPELLRRIPTKTLFLCAARERVNSGRKNGLDSAGFDCCIFDQAATDSTSIFFAGMTFTSTGMSTLTSGRYRRNWHMRFRSEEHTSELQSR